MINMIKCFHVLPVHISWCSHLFQASSSLIVLPLALEHVLTLWCDLLEVVSGEKIERNINLLIHSYTASPPWECAGEVLMSTKLIPDVLWT